MSKLFTLVFPFISLASINAFAIEVKDQRLYKAMNVAAVDVTSDGILGETTYQKKIGSLSCHRTQGVYPRAVSSYHCALVGDVRLDGKIYDVLNLPEKNITPDGLLGSSRFQKRVTDFACTKEFGVYPGATPEFSCGFVYETSVRGDRGAESSSETKGPPL